MCKLGRVLPIKFLHAINLGFVRQLAHVDVRIQQRDGVLGRGDQVLVELVAAILLSQLVLVCLIHRQRLDQNMRIERTTCSGLSR
jgi:hypothetical protein